MSKYIRCHLTYLLSKRNIISIVLINIGLIVYSLINAHVFEDISIIDSNRQYYKELYDSSFFLFIKMIYAGLIIFITMNYFSSEYSEYSSFFITTKRTKIKYELTRLITLLLVSFFELFFIYILYIFLMIFEPFKINYFNNNEVFLRLYLLSVIYILITAIFSMIFKSYFVVFFVLILFFLSSILSSFYTLNSFSKILIFIFPSLVSETNNFLFGYIQILIYSIFLLVVFLIINKSAFK